MPLPTTPRVRFAPELQVPAADRPRKAGVIYPRHAQSKGASEWWLSYDLYWGNSGVSDSDASSISEPTPTSSSISSTFISLRLNSSKLGSRRLSNKLASGQDHRRAVRWIVAQRPTFASLKQARGRESFHADWHQPVRLLVASE